MPVGTITLVVLAVLVYFGVLHRVLDRLGLTDRAALVWIAAFIVGGYLNVTLVRGANQLVLNVGGGLVPLLLAVFLFRHTDTAAERVRAAAATVITAGVMYGLAQVLPDEPTNMVLLDPLYIFALIGGLVAYLLGRSRRAAFVAGMLGLILVDIIHYLVAVTQGVRQRTWIGGAGAFDSVIIAGTMALLVAELVGETRERLAGGTLAVRKRQQRVTVKENTERGDRRDAEEA